MFFLGFCVECLILCKNLDAFYLVVKENCLITCSLCNGGLVDRFLVHGKSMVRVFGQKLRFFNQEIKKCSKNFKIYKICCTSTC